jgi:hypothetical protein
MPNSLGEVPHVEHRDTASDAQWDQVRTWRDAAHSPR